MEHQSCWLKSTISCPAGPLGPTQHCQKQSSSPEEAKGTLGRAAALGPPAHILGTTQPPQGAQSLAEALQWSSGRRVSWDLALISAGIKAPGREKHLTLQGSVLQWGGDVPVSFPANFCFVKATGKYFLWLTKQWDLWIGKLRIKREEISLLIKKLNNSVEDQLLESIPPEFEWNNFYLK